MCIEMSHYRILSTEHCMEAITITTFCTIIYSIAATNIFIPYIAVAYQVTLQTVMIVGAKRVRSLSCFKLKHKHSPPYSVTVFSVLVTKKCLHMKLPERANQCVIQYDRKLATAVGLSFHAATH
jgi:hypothetical protein